MEKLSELLLAIYRASRALPFAEFQDAALKLAKAVLPFDSCTWGTGTLTPQGLVFHSLHLHEEHPDRVRLYEDVKDQDTVPGLVRAHPGTTLNVHPPTFYRGQYQAGIRDYARRCGHQNSLVTGWVHPETQVAPWVGLYRADPDWHFSEAERQFAQCLAPHLMEALAVNRVLYAARLRTLHGSAPHHVAIADRLGLLYFTEPGFSELMGREWPHWTGGSLPPPLCAAVTDQPPDVYRGAHVAIHMTHVKDLVFLKARSTLPIDGLTARELAVAKHIAAGRTHKEIARLLNIAPATVRNHIQRIHDRLQVRNNAELVAQLNQFVP